MALTFVNSRSEVAFIPPTLMLPELKPVDEDGASARFISPSPASIMPATVILLQENAKLPLF